MEDLEAEVAMEVVEAMEAAAMEAAAMEGRYFRMHLQLSGVDPLTVLCVLLLFSGGGNFGGDGAW